MVRRTGSHRRAAPPRRQATAGDARSDAPPRHGTPWSGAAAPRVQAQSPAPGGRSSKRAGRATDRAQSTFRIRICTFTGLAPVDVFSSLQSGLPSTKTTAGPGLWDTGVVSLGET